MQSPQESPHLYSIDSPEAAIYLALLNEANKEFHVYEEEQHIAEKEGSTQQANEAFKQKLDADRRYLAMHDRIIQRTTARPRYDHILQRYVLVEQQ
ncbi:MAG TPA: hypothetical protein VH593_14350 [Ktedonobacteraceae bacterium]